MVITSLTSRFAIITLGGDYMSSEIAGPEETLLRLDSLEVTSQFFKENKIKEQSKTGQQMSELQDRIINRILSDSRIQIVVK